VMGLRCNGSKASTKARDSIDTMTGPEPPGSEGGADVPRFIPVTPDPVAGLGALSDA
jgi:hypothetical protein